ncbi:uncharacterized protein C8A04DRAFT_10173 [Dichotomopilus funicola]|uniref:General stress protein FMN-binding split barrel domain-containing protein n=1 Tax=Dichotomopilus funicola TaxID=1934379 RepID=A0AAN6V7C1_9PEZI|nr:hypothetical protein C8A04DRAFT_10173 [Dichotomopilus funicola]
MAEHQTEIAGKPADPYKATNLETDVPLEKKIQDLSHFIAHCKFAMMTTRDAATGGLMSRCMALAAQETGGIDLLFHTNTASGKASDLASDSHTNISFLNHSTGDWASISGTARVETDRSLVHKHYSSHLKAWLGDLGDGVHDGGPEDPRLGVIRVRMASAHYAVGSRGVVGHLAQVAQGVVRGKVAGVNKLREIGEEEVREWREKWEKRGGE